MTIQAQTTFRDIFIELSAIFDRGRLIPKDSELAVSLADRIEKLTEASEGEALYLRGMLQSLFGDIESAVDLLARSGVDRTDSDVQILCTYSNLGYATHGLDLYPKVGSPVTGSFTRCVIPGISVGAIRTIGHFISQADTMHLTNMEGVPVDLIRTAEKILEEAGTEDAAIARVLNVAGAVVRDYGLVHVGHVVLDASEAANCVKLRYRYAVSPQQAAWLYNEFLDRLYDEEVAIPPAFVVAFEGQGSEPEGRAEYNNAKSSEIRL